MSPPLRMRAPEAVKQLRELKDQHMNDPEHTHAKADEILLNYVPPSVRLAYEEVAEKAGGFYCS